MRRMCASGTTAALATTIAAAPSLAAADRTVTDPKIWCGEAAKTMAGKNAEKLIDSVASAAANLTDRHSLAVVCGERPFPAPKGGFRPSIYFN